MERWRERFFEAVNQGAVVDASGNRVPLDERRGIDVLGRIISCKLLQHNNNFFNSQGNMMEASILTPNSQLYGKLYGRN